MRLFFIMFALAACGDNQPPDCVDVGCDETMSLTCTRDGDCSCPQGDDSIVACYREPKQIGHH
jgi:hypothetical protein